MNDPTDGCRFCGTVDAKHSPRCEYDQAVHGPGKFEGEAPYVPYFWEQYLEGNYADDDGETLTFTVTDEDRRLFPELVGKETVELYERDDGFVIEALS